MSFNKSPTRTFRYIKNRSLSNMEPWGTHTSTSAKKRACLLSNTLCFLFLKNLNNEVKMLSDTPCCFSLKIMKSRHAISNDLKIAINLMIYGRRRTVKGERWKNGERRERRYNLHCKKKRTARCRFVTSCTKSSVFQENVIYKFTNKLTSTLHKICKYKGFLWATFSRI